MSETPKNTQEEVSAVTSGEDVTNKKRRKVLKTGGVLSGAIAAAHWHKPVLDSVVTPAHAQTTTGMSDDDNTGDMGDDDMPMPTTLLGATSGLASHTAFNNQIESKSNIASKLVDSLIPEAHAAPVPVNSDPEDIWRGLVNDVEQYQHCIELTLPAEEPPTTVDVTLTGPDVYYGIDGYAGAPATYYYFYSNNFSGAAMGAPLTDNAGEFEFSVEINGLTISGSIDSTLSNAEGSAIITTPLIVNGNVAVSGNSFDEAGYGGAFESKASGFTGYGAYWATTVGGSCSPGEGQANASTDSFDD